MRTLPHFRRSQPLQYLYPFWQGGNHLPSSSYTNHLSATEPLHLIRQRKANSSPLSSRGVRNVAVGTAIADAISQLKCGASGFCLLSAPSHIVVSIVLGLPRVADGLHKTKQLTSVSNWQNSNAISGIYCYLYTDHGWHQGFRRVCAR
jgi:hypothetical protein